MYMEFFFFFLYFYLLFPLDSFGILLYALNLNLCSLCFV